MGLNLWFSFSSHIKKWLCQLGKTQRFVLLSVVIGIFLWGAIVFMPSGVSTADQLEDAIKKIAAKQFKREGVDYAITVRCLKGCVFSFSLGQEKQFPAASLIKLPLLVVALEAASKEEISLQDTVTIAKNDITGGSGSLKGKKTPHSLTIAQLLEYMVATSDNTAANKVIELFGFSYLNERFNAIGLEDTVLARKIMDFSMRRRGVENYTSARDIAYLLEGLYRRNFFSRNLSQLGLSWLLKQKVNDRIPRFLPRNINVAHKTGLERGVVHDAGVVFTARSVYLICVLVKNEPEYARAKNFIALVSLITYNLINK